MTYTKLLARIDRADLGIEDHGLFGFNLDFDFGDGGHQGSGWYTLNNATGGPLLAAIMKAAGVDRWEQLKGRTVYVLKASSDYNARVDGFEKLPMDKSGGRIIFEEVIKKITG